MAEWSIASVLKTDEGHTSGGSNPSLSAIKPLNFSGLFFISFKKKKTMGQRIFNQKNVHKITKQVGNKKFHRDMGYNMHIHS